MQCVRGRITEAAPKHFGESFLQQSFTVIQNEHRTYPRAIHVPPSTSDVIEDEDCPRKANSTIYKKGIAILNRRIDPRPQDPRQTTRCVHFIFYISCGG